MSSIEPRFQPSKQDDDSDDTSQPAVPPRLAMR